MGLTRKNKMMKPERIEPGPGQESVWDYPRPPRVEPVDKPIRIVFNGNVIAETNRAQRVLETSHPPVYYIPLEDVSREFLVPRSNTSFCEFKGTARYYGLFVEDKQVPIAAWYYSNPSAGFETIKMHLAFYAGFMDACYVGDEVVVPQPGGFYGGWITSDIVGPFKGEPGTEFW